MTWWNYVRETAGTDNQADIARKVGVSQPSISQWRTSTPKPESVRAFAQAYGRPVVEAVIAAGILTEKEAREIC